MLHRVFKALADHPPQNPEPADGSSVLCLRAGTGSAAAQPLISRHLAYLKNSGLVQDHRQGMRVQYSISLDCQNRAGFDAFLRNALLSDLACCEDLRRCRQIEGEPGRRSKDEVTSVVSGIN
jgi:DNA-binding transcriptional ArsR family regulator